MQNSFFVKILSSQNATWQGTVTWAEGRKTEAFRSELELLRLMESALAAPPQEETEDA